MKVWYLKHEDIVLPTVMISIIISGWLTPLWLYIYLLY